MEKKDRNTVKEKLHMALMQKLNDESEYEVNQEYTEKMIKIEGVCDADDVVKAVNNTTQKSKDRTSWEIGRIRQMLMKKEISRVKWHEGSGNVSDALTKRGAPKHLMQRTIEFGMI